MAAGDVKGIPKTHDHRLNPNETPRELGHREADRGEARRTEGCR